MTDYSAGSAANPFTVPSQGEFFWLHKPANTADVEKAQRKDLRIWEKPTAASKNGATRTLRDHELPMAPVPLERQQQLKELRENVLAREKPDETFLTTIATKPAVGVCEPLKSQERDLRTYVAKKREAFLVQMALDVKKTEIVRLEEEARLQEEALAQSQQMLEEDTKKFEEFRQELFAKGRKIGNDAESAAKRKADKQQRIKHLRQQIAALQSETGKLREQKDEYERYKEFLEKLTPLEWKQQQAELKKARKARRRQNFIDERMKSVIEKLDEEERAFEKTLVDQAEGQNKKKKGHKQEKEESNQREKERQARQRRYERSKTDASKRISDEFVDVSSEEEPELNFKEPRQLMETFTELEEKNLFLIQSSQETEQMLDEIEQNFEYNTNKMTAKLKQLQDTIAALTSSMAQEQRNREELQRKLEEKAGTEASDRKLQDLQEMVKAVYLKCCEAKDQNADILQMLGGIESQLEVEIHGLDEAFCQEPELVMGLEKRKLKEQSERQRKEKMKELNDKQAERQKKALLRSQDPVFKKAGKQVMYRSPPLRQQRKVIKDTSDEERNTRDHQVFGMYIDRSSQMPVMEAPVIEDKRKGRTGAYSGGEADANSDAHAMYEFDVTSGAVNI